MSKSLDGVLIKKAHQQQHFTDDEIREFAACLDPDTGHEYFLRNYFYIQHPVKGQLLFDPFEYQERLIKSYHEYRFNINMLPRQTGKALSLDTLIPTATGWTTMGDINVGDKILGPDGKETTVTFATDTMYDHTCYKVTFDNNEEIIADADHLWAVTSEYWTTGSKNLTTEQIKEYIESRNASMYINAAAAISIDEDIELPREPYELGIELGTLSKSDLHNDAHIPNLYLRSSTTQRLDLLQGLMDANGRINNKNNHRKFQQKSLKLADQVAELLSSLGIKSKCKSSPARELNYCILFSNGENKKDTRHYFRSIEQVKSVPVRCIQVDNQSHLFLCGKSMIPTHNTTCAAGYLLWYAMFKPDQTILIAAHKFLGAQEIMNRIRYAYELCPDHIRAGVTNYNKGSIEFENGSRIVSQATTTNTGRGMSISLLYCLDGDTSMVKVRNKSTLVEEEISLAELYGRLSGASKVIT